MTTKTVGMTLYVELRTVAAGNCVMINDTVVTRVEKAGEREGTERVLEDG